MLFATDMVPVNHAQHPHRPGPSVLSAVVVRRVEVQVLRVVDEELPLLIGGLNAPGHGESAAGGHVGAEVLAAVVAPAHQVQRDGLREGLAEGRPGISVREFAG